MFGEKNISASIVIYKEDPLELQKTINSFLGSPHSKRLYIIDNSPPSNREEKIKGEIVEYLYPHHNIGFGKGHNSILNKIKNNSEYHLILNPDVQFDPRILEKMILELKNDENLSVIVPKAVYPNKELQYTARKFPTILELICRYLGIFRNYTRKKEYRDQNLEKSFYPDFIQGSFMLFKTKDLIALQGFDKRYFMYMEDVDICRRIDQSGKKKLYYPHVEVIHSHRKGSSKNFRLFFVHIISLIKYFMKWTFKI